MLEFTSPMTVQKAIRMSWASLLNPALFLRLLIPVFLTVLFCLALLVWGWPLVTLELVPYLNRFAFVQWSFGALEHWLGFSVLTFVALLLFIVAIFIALYFILILLTSLILVPILTSVVQKNYFPQVLENSELSFMGSLQNSLHAFLWFFLYFFALSPLFIFLPGGQLIVPYFLNAYIARRAFPYDVLQNYATAAEFERFRLKENKSLWSLSLLTAGYFYLPFVNFLAAPMSALAFVFFCLGKMAEYRRK